MYQYKLSGRLWTRAWKRGITTTCGYNVAGDLWTVSYSDGTPGLTYTYDRRGRRATAVRNGITTTWTYNDANQSLTETDAGGTLAGLSMTWTYDNYLRRDVATAKSTLVSTVGLTNGPCAIRVSAGYWPVFCRQIAQRGDDASVAWRAS